MKKEKGKKKSKKAWRISIFLASILSPFFILLSPCSACTGFYVGRKVSADGTTMIGRTVDAAPWNGPMREVRFERIEIVDGKALLDVSVWSSDAITNQDWSVATNGVIEVPAPGKQGFFILKSKGK